MITTVRIYMPNGRQIVYRDSAKNVSYIETKNQSVVVKFNDGTSRAFVGMPYEEEMGLKK